MGSLDLDTMTKDKKVAQLAWASKNKRIKQDNSQQTQQNMQVLLSVSVLRLSIQQNGKCCELR